MIAPTHTLSLIQSKRWPQQKPGDAQMIDDARKIALGKDTNPHGAHTLIPARTGSNTQHDISRKLGFDTVTQPRVKQSRQMETSCTSCRETSCIA